MAASRVSPTGSEQRAQGALPAGAVPHGYDQCEFAPEQCTRDFSRSRRPREPDEERRQLRLADAAIGDHAGSEVRPTGRSFDGGPSFEGKWDADDDQPVDGSSRLYKD